MFASSSGASISSSRQNGLGWYLKMREHQRDRGERLLAARQQLHALQALAGRLRDDLDAALERIVLVEQRRGRRGRRRTACVNVAWKLRVDRGERLARTARASSCRSA